MLQSLKRLEGYTVDAVDGYFGTVADVVLDHQDWSVRYFVVTSGIYFGKREMLIAPSVIREVDWSTRGIHLNLHREAIRASPNMKAGFGDSDKADEPLQRAHDLRGFRVEGTDVRVGRVSDFIVDDAAWAVRYLSIDTSHYWLGSKVLIAPAWASRVDWQARTIHIDRSRRSVRESPAWVSQRPIERAYERQLHAYYGENVYWTAADGEQRGSLASDARAIKRLSPLIPPAG